MKTFKKALLVMHSPLDQVVSVDHAAKIFSAAKHPKSFVTLDKADHLLLSRKDARYAGKVIGAWVLRYITQEDDAAKLRLDKGVVLVKARMNTKFTQDVFTKDHHIIVDEPLSYKGDNLGMTPYNHLLAGLGSCTAMTVKMYAERKGISLEEIQVELRHSKIHAEDCEGCETKSDKIDIIEKKLCLKGDFSKEEEARLHEIAERCPVNRTLKSEIQIKTIGD